jgi:MoxR-like ATPase
MLNPRHTDHDRHAYLPQKVADEISRARKEIQSALDELPKDAP